MRIIVDDLSGGPVMELLAEHLRSMHEVTPAGSVHALDPAKLREPGITFWSVWDGEDLAGCGALKETDPRHGEVKSMKTARAHLQKGVASLLLNFMIDEAIKRGYQRLYLETGATDAFLPARRLYEKFGFVERGPFGSYREDPHSYFMEKNLEG